MPGAEAGLPTEVHQWSKSLKGAADDGHHQREAEDPCAHKGLGRPADAEPDRKLRLGRTREDTLTRERRSKPSLPMHRVLHVEPEQQPQLLDEQVVIVAEVQVK